MGFPDELVVKKSACNAGDQGSIPGSEDSLEKREATPPVFLPRESYGQRSLVGYCPWGRKESNINEWLTHAYTHTHAHTHRSHICPGCLTVCEVTHRVLQWSDHLLFRICSLNPTNFSQYSQSILLTSLMVVPKIKVVNSDENCMWENSGGKNENKSTQWVELKVVSILRN